MIKADTVDQMPRGEPWGPRLWLAFAIVLVAATCLQSYGIRTWPMADDEVPSLVEMGLIRRTRGGYEPNRDVIRAFLPVRTGGD